jgi:hypothetical protein
MDAPGKALAVSRRVVSAVSPWNAFGNIWKWFSNIFDMNADFGEPLSKGTCFSGLFLPLRNPISPGTQNLQSESSLPFHSIRSEIWYKKRNARTFVCQNGCPLTSNYISLKVWRFPWLFPLWLILVQGARAGGMVSNGAEKCRVPANLVSFHTFKQVSEGLRRFREGWEPHFAVQHEAFWWLQEPLGNMQLFRLHGKDTLWRSEALVAGDISSQ